MQVKPKYNIGDKLWTWEPPCEEVFQCIIKEIDINVSGSNKQNIVYRVIDIDDGNHVLYYKKEKDLFKDKHWAILDRQVSQKPQPQIKWKAMEEIALGMGNAHAVRKVKLIKEAIESCH